MNNCQLFTFQVRKIAARRKYTKNRRTCNENCCVTLRQDAGRWLTASNTLD